LVGRRINASSDGLSAMPQTPTIFPKLFLIGAVILSITFAAYVWGVPRFWGRLSFLWGW